MTDNVLVTIIVPAYNAESTIRACVESILGQSYRNLELIVVDDGSTDCTEAQLVEVGKLDSRVRVLRGGHHGVSHARNLGIGAATGSWVAFCDADDIMPPGAVESMLGMISEAPIVAGAISFDYLTGDGVVKKSIVKSSNGSHVIDKMHFAKSFDEMWSMNSVQSSCSKLFSMKQMNASPEPLRFDEGLSSYEDLDFVLRFLARSDAFALVGDVCYRYLNRLGDSNHNRFKLDMNDQMERVALLVERFYRDVLGDEQCPSSGLKTRQLMIVAVNNAAKAPGGREKALEMLQDLFGRPVFQRALVEDDLCPNGYTRLVICLARWRAYGTVLRIAKVRNIIRSRRAY